MISNFVIIFLICWMSPSLANFTTIHEHGYCAMYSTGGKKSFFGADLPNPQNIPAQRLSLKDQSLLVEICGSTWTDTQFACCDNGQLENLKTNLKKAEPLISSCPACKDNFFQIFCHFTCSPNQSTFVNVTKVDKSMSGNDIVSELDYFIDDSENGFATEFFDSCKNIKFGATNGYAMDLIGGGATTPQQFLKFLGDEKPMLGGSPFQINFEYKQDESHEMNLLNLPAHKCNDSDPDFRCACSDCPSSCPDLPALQHEGRCMVNGTIPCFSLAIIIIYGTTFAFYVVLYLFLRYKKSNEFNFLSEDSLLPDSLIEDEDITFGEENNSEDDTFSNFDNFRANDSYVINNWLEECFYKLGKFCSMHPKRIIVSTLALSCGLSSLILLLKLETNPVNLWVSPTADAYLQRKTYDESFGPFYRTQQIYISNATGDSVLQDFEAIQWWFKKEGEISSILSGDYEGTKVTYDDVCYKPLGDSCILESFTQYFYGDINQLNRLQWQKQIKDCADSPVNCLPSFQQPLKRELVFGGDVGEDVLKAKAIVATLLVNNDNDPDSETIKKAEAWEYSLETYLLDLVEQAKALGLDVSFSTEISLEKELNKSTNTDARIVVISYLVMFAYASLALGSGGGSGLKMSTPEDFSGTVSSLSKLLLRTRFGLGLIGIFIVLFSVCSSAGFWSLMGLKSTLIIAEVIPFLILAVGVDNIFLITNELKDVNNLNVNNELDIHERIGKTMANIGPSILLSSSCQFICFLLASFVGMPAVKNFALYSAFSILFNTLLQMTCFVSVLSLDQVRIEDGRLDLIPFVKANDLNNASLPGNDEDLGLLLQSNISNSDESLFTRIIRDHFAPFLFMPKVRKAVIGFFVVWLGISLALLPEIQLALDQRIAIPSDSYLINYFNSVYEYLNVGPPIYFVVSDLDVTKIENQQKLCGKFTTCDEFSLASIIEQEYKRPNESTIAEPVASWIDDFLLWTNPDLSDCCRYKKGSTEEFCSPYQPPRQCEVCYGDQEWSFKMDGFPENETFIKYFNQWKESPSDPCPLGGKAPYSNALYIDDESGDYSTAIKRSAFRTSHKPLRSQDEFIDAYHNSLRVVEEIKANHEGLNIFAYSPFYIFFVQYETIIKLTITLVLVGLGLVFLITSFLLGSFKNALVLIITVSFILIDIGGMMAIWGISLNAISLVNLMICLGLSVEFSIHLIKHFNFNSNGSQPSSMPRNSKATFKMNRAFNSLVFIGNSTLSGITLTKFIGISVLSFTRSKIFQIYYFRMWLSLIIVASLHSLVLLPLLLGYFGSSKSFISSQFATFTNEDVLRLMRNRR